MPTTPGLRSDRSPCARRHCHLVPTCVAASSASGLQPPPAGRLGLLRAVGRPLRPLLVALAMRRQMVLGIGRIGRPHPLGAARHRAACVARQRPRPFVRASSNRRLRRRAPLRPTYCNCWTCTATARGGAGGGAALHRLGSGALQQAARWWAEGAGCCAHKRSKLLAGNETRRHEDPHASPPASFPARPPQLPLVSKPARSPAGRRAACRCGASAARKRHTISTDGGWRGTHHLLTRALNSPRHTTGLAPPYKPGIERALARRAAAAGGRGGAALHRLGSAAPHATRWRAEGAGWLLGGQAPGRHRRVPSTLTR